MPKQQMNTLRWSAASRVWNRKDPYEIKGGV